MRTAGPILLAISLLLVGAAPCLSAPSFLVEPYLQSPGTDRMTVMWETNDGNNRLEYWEEGQPSTIQAATQVPGRVIYAASLSGLASNTLYRYRVLTDGGTGDTYAFKTWPAQSDGVDALKMVAFSDSQGNHPARLQDICENGIIARECTAGLAENCAGEIAAVLVAGDLVSDGAVVEQWRDEFFGRCKALFHYVPVLPAIGNHDDPIDNYLDYFTLPGNGSGLNEEEWYTVDLLNLRLVTLSTETIALAQWPWLDDVMNDACGDPDIDFVMAQFHRPCKSEPWPQGEDIRACSFKDRLETFTAACGKPSVHQFGHTHAYSRGQSRDMAHLWVNVATSAGDIDTWGEYEIQPDYNEFQVSYDEYGFVVWHLTRGPDASYALVRRTGGDDENYYGYTDETIQDEVTLLRTNTPPDTPVPVSPVGVEVGGNPVLLEAGPFSDPDGDTHLASHWQITEVAGDYSNPVQDVWGNSTRVENVYFDVDTQAGDDITKEAVTLTTGGKTYYWRVRYRDEHLGWSDWSTEAGFTTASSLPWAPASVVGAGTRKGSVPLNALLALLIPAAGILLTALGRMRAH